MKHSLIILISLLLLSSPVIGQSERPETIIVPVSGIGDVSNTRKLILENTLTDELKKHFRIVPQEKYEQVLEQVFQELEYEECSEDTCIMRIQEILQVENVFNLQIIGEGKDTQLNLKWITLDEKKNETDYCERCNTKKLNDKVRSLVEKLVGEKRVEVVVEKKQEVIFEKKEKGVLYLRYGGFAIFGWYKSGNEKKNIKYIGQIQNGKPNGQGTFTFPGGNKYVGGWKDDKRNGQGTFTWSGGNKYVGKWKDDRKDDQGTFTSSNGEKYIGKWKDDKKDGQGTYTSSNGEKYIGEWKDDKRNGQGIKTWYDGDKYVGEWKDGKQNGQGTYTYSNGMKYVGERKEDKRWNGTQYDKDGNILGKYVNGSYRPINLL
jgi:hypothetical protein